MMKVMQYDIILNLIFGNMIDLFNLNILKREVLLKHHSILNVEKIELYLSNSIEKMS